MKITPIFLTAISIAMLVGCAKRDEGVKAPACAAPIPVATVAATRRTMVLERTLSGVLDAYREADLAPLTPGRVKSLPLKIGDNVRAGQTVALMDDAPLVAAIAQFQPVKAQYERSQSLYAGAAMPKVDFETIEAHYTAAKRQVESLQENTVLKAPFAGVITARAVEEGELFVPPSDPLPGQPKGLVRITQLDPLKVDLKVDDQAVAHVKKGMAVRIYVNMAPDSADINGTVEWVNPRAEPASRTYEVRVIVPNKGLQLRPGYSAEARLVLGTRDGVLTVPRNAVIDGCVRVLNGAKPESRTVRVGWLTAEYAEIVSGLDEGAVVVVGEGRGENH